MAKGKSSTRINPYDLLIGDVAGEGSFGVVYRGIYKNAFDVAVKKVNRNSKIDRINTHTRITFIAPFCGWSRGCRLQQRSGYPREDRLSVHNKVLRCACHGRVLLLCDGVRAMQDPWRSCGVAKHFPADEGALLVGRCTRDGVSARHKHHSQRPQARQRLVLQYDQSNVFRACLQVNCPSKVLRFVQSYFSFRITDFGGSKIVQNSLEQNMTKGMGTFIYMVNKKIYSVQLFSRSFPVLSGTRGPERRNRVRQECGCLQLRCDDAWDPWGRCSVRGQETLAFRENGLYN